MTRAISETTGFPVVGEREYWRVRDIDRNYAYYEETTEYQRLEEKHSDITFDSVVVELRVARTAKVDSYEYYHRAKTDGSIVKDESDPYLYRLRQTGTKLVREAVLVGFWGTRTEWSTREEPVYEKEYLTYETSALIGQHYSPTTDTKDLLKAALLVLDKREREDARKAVLGDYPPKTLNGENA